MVENNIVINNTIGTETMTLTSMEVAQMVEKEHRKLLRDIRNYSEQLNQTKIGLVEFFQESSYLDKKGELRPCYLVTKKGCEFIAHKLTGIKGTLFTAKYINRFHEMEETIANNKLNITKRDELVLKLYHSTNGIDNINYAKELVQLETKPLVDKIEQDAPKVEYHNKVLCANNLISTTDIAKDLGMSAIRLNKLLNVNRILFKNGDCWKPYANYEWLITDGYADYKIGSFSYKPDKLKDDKVVSTQILKWTEKGRKWIIENYKNWISNEQK